MNVSLKHITVVSFVFLALIAANVYQFQNPKTVKVPEKQTEIDEGAWVKQSAYADRGMIIDSLEAQNKKLANRVKESQDKIASYVSITGRLKTQVDSLVDQPPSWNAIPLTENLLRRDSIAVADTTFSRSKTFGNGLFRVDGFVDVKYSPNRGLQIRQDFDLNQIRDIRLDVASTVNENRSRALVYVTSPDFENLEYQSFTEFEPETKLPKFWIGVGVGAGAVLTTIILLN